MICETPALPRAKTPAKGARSDYANYHLFRYQHPHDYEKIVDILNKHSIANILNQEDIINSDGRERLFDCVHAIQEMIEQPNLVRSSSYFLSTIKDNLVNLAIAAEKLESPRQYFYENSLKEISKSKQRLKILFSSPRESRKELEAIGVRSPFVAKIPDMMATASILYFISLLINTWGGASDQASLVPPPLPAEKIQSGIEGTATMYIPNSEAGKIPRTMVLGSYTPNAKIGPYLSNVAYYYQDGKKVKLACNGALIEDNEKPVYLSSVKLEARDYRRGELLHLLRGPYAGVKITAVKVDPPCKFSLGKDGSMCFSEAVRGACVSYDLVEVETPSVRALDLRQIPQSGCDQLPEHIAPFLNSYKEQGLIKAAREYFKDFRYLLSEEVNDMVARMPGCIEYKTRFLKIGDCDVFVAHLAFELSSYIPMVVHNGYLGFADNDRKKIYGDSGHAWIVALESNGEEKIIESTAKTRSEHIMPGGKPALLPKHKEQLENLVILIEKTNVREERETLMRQFSELLGNFLDNDPYYKQFKTN